QLLWTDQQTLLSADDAGQIFLSSLAKQTKLFFAADFLFKADSRIVQLDYAANRLLISTMTRSTIIHLATRAAANVKPNHPFLPATTLQSLTHSLCRSAADLARESSALRTIQWQSRGPSSPPAQVPPSIYGNHHPPHLPIQASACGWPSRPRV